MPLCPPCVVCCTVCAAQLPRTPLNCVFGNPDSDKSRPFALDNLLAVGTLSIKRAQPEEPSLCDHAHEDDGWHRYDGSRHSTYLEEDGASLSKMLWLLTKHEFIKITYNITSEETLTLRIYLVPVDLSGVKGKLHHKNRQDRILGPARQHLRKLLPQISRSKERWYGYSGADTSTFENLLGVSPVCVHR
jgi:hypothetical protein